VESYIFKIILKGDRRYWWQGGIGGEGRGGGCGTLYYLCSNLG